ncbi:MAG: hypothetical protein OHK0046_01190 [Anaerolineae bacterium]
MFKQFQLFLGQERLRALVLLLGLTGLFSLILNTVVEDYDWVRPAQTILAFVFLIGAAIIIGTRLDPFERGRWASLLVPALGAVALGAFVIPQYLGLLVGASIGWVVAGIFIFRPRGPMAYQQAVKHLRRSEYADAVKVMDEVIKDDPNQPNHYRFRAEILRLWGKLDRARRDYEKMIQIDPESAVAYNGLAEVLLQAGQYAQAQTAALKAYELAPDEWVAAYNLGMIEDRLGDAPNALRHLDLALNTKVPDARHRLLIHFYRARAHARLGDFEAARAAVEIIKKQRGGLNEWQMILESEQAETLRAVLAADIQAAEALVNDEMTVEALA